MTRARILVTGASGFTGGHLVRRLAAEGHTVRAVVRRPDVCDDLRSCGIEVVKGDLLDLESLARACKGIDLIYHIAAIFRAQGISSKLFWDINVDGTRRLLDAAIQQGVARFVHCSTIGVHGHIGNPPANEETPYAPGDIYQESKVAGEKIAIDSMEKGEIALTVFRPAGIYGPGDMRFLKIFRAINKRRFPMLGSGEILYHFTYITDLVDGIILCGTKENAAGQIYILGGERYLMLNEVVAMIAAELGVPGPRIHIPLWPVYLAGACCEAVCRPFGIEPPLYRRRIDFFSKSRAFDISKAKRELGYRPNVDLKDGIQKTAEWYRQNNLL